MTKEAKKEGEVSSPLQRRVLGLDSELRTRLPALRAGPVLAQPLALQERCQILLSGVFLRY